VKVVTGASKSTLLVPKVSLNVRCERGAGCVNATRIGATGCPVPALALAQNTAAENCNASSAPRPSASRYR